MRKYKKIILIVLAAVLIIALGIGLYAAGPILAMRPAKTGQIPDTDVFAVRAGIGTVYFIDTGGGYVMVDAGSNARKLLKAMEKHGIPVEDVHWILLTHTDYDHTAGLQQIKSADVYLGEEEQNALGKPPRYNILPEGLYTNHIHTLAHGGELRLGPTVIRCIQAPGHTAGSVAYLVNEQYLFTGDAIRLGKADRLHPFTQDEARAGETIEALKALPCTHLFSTHYGYQKAEE